VGKARGKAERAHRAEVGVEVSGVRRGCDAGAAVVGPGKTGAGDRNSSGAQSVEGDKGEVKDVVWDPAAFHKAKAVGEGRPPYSPESCGAGMGGGSAVGRRENPWEHKGEVGGWGEFF